MKSSQELMDYQIAVEGFIESIFANENYKPEIKAERTYGIPSFVMQFATDDEKNHAESNGLTNEFLEKVQKLCDEFKPHGEKFDSKMAVTIYSKEDEKRWAQKAKAFRKKADK